jgi:Uma2 family endonuclease
MMNLQLLDDTARRHRWTVAEYLKLVESGVFAEDDRIELIDGELIDMAPIGDEHAGQVNRLSNDLAYLLYRRVVVATQNPIMLDQHSDPQPDICLLRWREDFYRGKRPGPADVLLVMEVADTTVRYDREVKVPLYARFGIPEAWLVDLPGKRVEVYRDPGDGRYRRCECFEAGRIAAVEVPEAVVDVGALFGV